MVDQRALATSPVDSADLWRGVRRLELSNATSPVLSCGNGGDVEVEDALAKLWAGSFG